MPISTLNHFFLALNLSYCVIPWQISDSSLEATPLVLVILGTAFAAFSLASSVFMSVATIARLLIVRRKHIRVMGKHLSLPAIEGFTEGFFLWFLTGNSAVAGQYWGIAAILIDSYAMDTVWVIGTWISFELKNAPSNHLFIDCMMQVDVSTGYLKLHCQNCS
jgi:hypothetical protein